MPFYLLDYLSIVRKDTAFFNGFLPKSTMKV